MSSEAESLSKSVLDNIIDNVISSQNAKKSPDEISSLANALESLTEESAKEIFGEEETLDQVSKNTNKIIARFLGQETPTPTPENSNFKNLEESTLELTFSDSDSISLNLENSRPESKLSNDVKLMREVVDEFAVEEEFLSTENLNISEEKDKGRRTKSRPKKRALSLDEEKEKEIEEDVEQIVEFLKETEPLKKASKSEPSKANKDENEEIPKPLTQKLKRKPKRKGKKRRKFVKSTNKKIPPECQKDSNGADLEQNIGKI